jgi:hypothetical protein
MVIGMGGIAVGRRHRRARLRRRRASEPATARARERHGAREREGTQCGLAPLGRSGATWSGRAHSPIMEAQVGKYRERSPPKFAGG